MANTVPTAADTDETFDEMSDEELDAYFAATDYFVAAEDGRRMFDGATRKYMGMSGEEFLRRWDEGEFTDLYDKPGYWYVGYLVSLRSFAEQEP
jgi:hypothetical protein